MSSFYQAVAGTLESNVAPGAGTKAIKAANYFPFPVRLYHLNASGRRDRYWYLGVDSNSEPGGAQWACSIGEWSVGDTFVWLDAFTGALIAASVVNETYDHIDLMPTFLHGPNDIGPVPQPTTDAQIPRDTAAACVGYGQISYATSPVSEDVGFSETGDGWVIRSQRWRMQAHSCTLAPGETREISYSVSEGMQTTTSVQANVAASLSLSANIGWGPIGASLSGSFSASGSISAQATMSSETDVYMTEELSNPSATSVSTILRWQLIERFSFVTADGKPIAVVDNALSPVVTKAYGQ